MARRRLRRASRKEQDREAFEIANYVYAVARDLTGREQIRHVQLAFPRQISAPLIYLAEMGAIAVCKAQGWKDRERADEVALYLLQGLQEALVSLVRSFDEEHFEAWRAAAGARIPE